MEITIYSLRRALSFTSGKAHIMDRRLLTGLPVGRKLMVVDLLRRINEDG